MAGKYTAQQLAGLPLGTDTYESLASALGGYQNERSGGTEWAAPEYVMAGESSPLLGPNAMPRQDIMDRLASYTYDWTPNGGYGASGSLTGYDQAGNQVANLTQMDQSAGTSLGELAALSAAAFGGLGLAGAGPLSGLQGLIGGTPGLGADMALGAGGGLPAGGNAMLGSIGGLEALPAVGLDAGMIPSMPGIASGGGGMNLGNIFSSIGGGLGDIGSKIGSTLGNMGGSDWLKLGGNLLSAGLESRGISKAAQAQQDAARQSNDLLRSMYDQNRQDIAPWREAGAASLGRLQEMLGLSGNAQAPGYGSLMQGFSGADVATEPGYQFGLQQGEQSIDRSAGAQGKRYSGATLKALQRYGQDYAGTKFNEAFARDTSTKNRMFNQLSGVAGTGQTATQNIGQQGMGMVGQVGQNLMGAGNVNGASALARGNMLADLLNQGISGWNRRSSGGRAGIGVPTSPEGWY